MKTKIIKLSDIVIDEDTQQRESIDLVMVAEYAESIQCGSKFPPITVFFDSAQYWLADGYHRYYAHKESGIPDIQADINDGTKDDAVMFSFGANGTHGKRLTNADKHKNVKKALSFHRTKELSDRDIAKICHVTHPFVSKIRKEVVTVTTFDDSYRVGNVSTFPLEPASNLEYDQKLSTGNESEKDNSESEEPECDEKEQIILELKDTVISLDEENTRLKDAIAANQLPEDEIQSAAEIIADLRSHVKTLEATLEAVKSSRDSYLRENEQLKKQCAMQRKQLQKMGSAA